MRKKLVHLRQYLRLTGKSLRLRPTRIRHFWKRKCCCPDSYKRGRPKLLWRAVFRSMGFPLADGTSPREKKKVEREKERKKKKKTQGFVMTRPNRPTYPKKIFLTSVPWKLTKIIQLTVLKMFCPRNLFQSWNLTLLLTIFIQQLFAKIM